MSSVALAHPGIISDSQANLHPLARYNPVSAKTSHKIWSALWTVAALTTAVAFTAFAIFVNVYAATYASAQFPVIALLVMAIGLPTSFKAFDWMWKKSSKNADDAAFDQKIIEIIHTSPEKKLISPLEARRQHLESLKNQKINEANKLQSGKTVRLKVNKEMIDVNPRDYTIAKLDFTKPRDVAIFHALQRVLEQVDHLKTDAALLNLEAAYTLKVIKNPSESHDMSHFMHLINLSSEQRRIAKENGDKNYDVLVKTPNGYFYTRDQLIAKNTATLAKEIFQLKTGFFG